MPFTVGQRLACINAAGAAALSATSFEGFDVPAADDGHYNTYDYYEVTWVSPGGTAIQVKHYRDLEDDDPEPLQPRFQVRRFRDYAEWLAEKQREYDEANVDPYEVSEFVGCCGADTLFFDGANVNKVSLLATIGDRHAANSPLVFAIVNQAQIAASRPILEECGFKLVGQSGSNHNGGLYAFLLIQKEIPAAHRVEVA